MECSSYLRFSVYPRPITCPLWYLTRNENLRKAKEKTGPQEQQKQTQSTSNGGVEQGQK